MLPGVITFSVRFAIPSARCYQIKPSIVQRLPLLLRPENEKTAFNQYRQLPSSGRQLPLHDLVHSRRERDEGLLPRLTGFIP